MKTKDDCPKLLIKHPSRKKTHERPGKQLNTPIEDLFRKDLLVNDLNHVDASNPNEHAENDATGTINLNEMNKDNTGPDMKSPDPMSKATQQAIRKEFKKNNQDNPDENTL